MNAYPGLYRDVLTYLRERIKEVLTGTSAAIVVRLYGPEMDVLRAKAGEVDKVLASVNGGKNRKGEPQVLLPQIEVRLRPEYAERYGLTASQVRRASTALPKGLEVGKVEEGQKKYDVVVWGVPNVRGDVAAVRALQIDTPSGGVLSLGSLVGFVTVLGIAARNGIMIVSHFRHWKPRKASHSARLWSSAERKSGWRPS